MDKQQRILFWIATLAVFSAVLAHSYLTQHHLEFRYGQGAGGGICNISDRLSCSHTSASSFSEFLGIPIALFGALVNFVLLCLLFAYRYPLVSKSTQYALTTSLKLLSLAIFLVSLIMGGISLFALNALCPVCAFTYFASFISLLAVWRLIPGNLGFSMFEVKLIPSLALTVLAFGFFINHNMKKEFMDPKLVELTQLQFEDWQKRNPKNLTTTSPLKMGPEDAKMVIVEFADFLCGHCAAAYPIIHKFLKTHPDVRFEFQAFPLDGACNSAIPHSSGVSCLLAQVSHCAGEQEKTWDTQEWIFNNQRDLLNKESIRSRLNDQAAALGINSETLWTCAEDSKTIETIRAQAELGTQLKITGTPTMFINGKKVSGSFSAPLLERVYRSLN